MYVDFAIIDTDNEDKKVKELVSSALKYNINSITVPYYLLKTCKPILKNCNVDLSCLIDFPLGISDCKTRCYAVEQAIAFGIDSIDITMPQNLAANRKYEKIREDIRNIRTICSNNVKIKYILEYRSFDHRCLKKICSIFDDYKIEFAIPSSGFFIDNLADNLIASSFLHENSKEIRVIATGNAWTENHFSILYKSGVYGFRTFNIESLKNFKKFTATIA
jgi:deoxyribose-phosphate aldolase